MSEAPAMSRTPEQIADGLARAIVLAGPSTNIAEEILTTLRAYGQEREAEATERAAKIVQDRIQLITEDLPAWLEHCGESAKEQKVLEIESLERLAAAIVTPTTQPTEESSNG